MEINWKKATIFDLTDNIVLINEIVGYEVDKEEYVRYVVPISKIIDMFSFAEHTGNNKLLKKLETMFKKDVDAFFNE